jgi:hypothetical protein
MDDLRDRALRAARAAETPAERKRREAEAKAKTSGNARLQQLIREANEICQRELGVRAHWHPYNDNRAVYAEIEGVKVEYRGHGRLSHTLASLGKGIARYGPHTCPHCTKELFGEPKYHIRDECPTPPFSTRVGRLLRKIFPNTLGDTAPAVRPRRSDR